MEPADGVVSRQQGCQDHQYSSHSERLLSSDRNLNAVRIISILPILAVSTKAAFRQKGAGAYNLTEHIIAQAYIACQLLLLNVLALPFYSDARVGSLYGLPALLLFLLFCWDYKQLFLCSWWRSFWRTILVVVYCLLFLALTTSLIAVVNVSST